MSPRKSYQVGEQEGRHVRTYCLCRQLRSPRRKARELKTALNELVEFVEANEPQLTAYNVYLNKDNTRVTVINVHRDAASLEFHTRVAGPLFPKFVALVKLLTTDLYGTLTDQLMEQMRRKAQMLGGPGWALCECMGSRQVSPVFRSGEPGP